MQSHSYNRAKWTLICLVILQFVTVQTYAADSPVVAAVRLTQRLVPQYARKFVFEQLKTPGDSDTFELESKAGNIIIRGNNANSMAVGLNHYLKYYCNVSVSWYKDDKIRMPVQLPVILHPVKQTARCHNRFMLNYCTFGYTMPWWQWADWQWFIDWMALNGINMPLAITGQEAVWYNVWQKFGLNDKEIRGYFTGPAFLPWHRMANLDHWDGPLPMSWINGQMKLQQKIVQREEELGMRPVLPAFAGHVPEIIKTKYPSAKITSLGEWGGFSKQYQSYFLDPFDPLFNKIQAAFLTEQTRLFGTCHIYGTDPFNEVTPPSWEPDYLASVSKIIYNSMQSNDPQAQWLQMTWIFYFQRNNWTNERIKAFLQAVPQNKMILLDYYCDNTEVWKITDKFFGQPYLWCYLGNFGSNTMLTGDLKETETRMEDAFENGGSNMWGIGSTLEGFGVNPVMIEYVFEKAWSAGPVNVDTWVNDWAIRRKGGQNKSAELAWEILNKKVYNQIGALGQGTLTNSRPSFGENDGWPANPKITYDNRDLLKAWQLLNTAASANATDVYKYDLVNVGRQTLGNYFYVLRGQFEAAYKKHDLATLQKTGNEMMQVIHDLDRLLATNSSFLLGKWIAGAKALGTNDEEKQYFEHDARTILTTWGQQGGELTDYANRNLSVLTNDYYGKRWQMFIDDVINAVKNNEQFDQKAFNNKSAMFEWNWTKKHDAYPSVTQGNSIQVSKSMYNKYAPAIMQSN